MAIQFKIHPSIGIARLGNAPAKSHFIGPEVPFRVDERIGKSFRKNGALRPQGARFRVFAFDDETGKCEELHVGQTIESLKLKIEAIRWTVHLANKKAYWHVFKGRIGETSPDIPPQEVEPYPPVSLRNDSIKGAPARRQQLIIESIAALTDGKRWKEEARQDQQRNVGRSGQGNVARHICLRRANRSTRRLVCR